MASPTGLPLADSLLQDADRLLTKGRNAESVMAIARALEVTLAASACARLLSAADPQRRSLPAELGMLHKRYMKTIGSMSLSALRNVVIAMVTRDVRPGSIAEALDFIEQSKRYGAITPGLEHFAAIRDPGARATMETLRDAPIIELCGAVLHQRHEPDASQAEQQRKAVADLSRALVALFGI